MESLNLNTLASSLPGSQQNAEKAEKELLHNFRAAAMSITELFRSSKKASKKAYNNGYTAACHDLLTFIQQGVSVGEVAESASAVSQRVDGDGMNIGRVMDWIEGRIDAVIAREEEEEEEEEREKDKERTGPSTARATPTVVAALSKQERPKATNFPSNSPISSKEPTTGQSPPPVASSSSSPSPPLPPAAIARMTAKPTKVRPPSRETFQPAVQAVPFPTADFHSGPYTSPVSSATHSESPIVISAGSKRRHAMMMMLDANSAPLPISGDVPGTPVIPSGQAVPMFGGSNAHSLNKRRSRNMRNLNPGQNQNLTPADAMDVEEEGRERKRVARR